MYARRSKNIGPGEANSSIFRVNFVFAVPPNPGVSLEEGSQFGVQLASETP